MEEQQAHDGTGEEEAIPEYGHRMSTWPVFWGVIAIIFGVVGLLAQAWKGLPAAGMMMMPKNAFQEAFDAQTTSTGTPPDPQMEKMMEQMMESQRDMMTAMVEMAPLSLASAVALSMVALILIIGGIMLCARKRIASPTLQTWAYLKIVAGGFGAWVGYKESAGMLGSMGDSMNAAMSTSGAPPPTGMTNMGNIMDILALAGVIIGIIWILLLPIFFLCWFNRPAVKEDMKHGQGW